MPATLFVPEGQSMRDESDRLGHRYVIGHGIDLVDLEDFSQLLRPPAGDFLDRHFTEAELAAAGEGINRASRLAARFAMKEAVMKALGAGWGDGIAFTDVEIFTQPSGAPSVQLHRRLEELRREREIDDWLVSASHSKSMVVASAIAVRFG
jgi:holo-[acyl-carrier protein] synthase